MLSRLALANGAVLRTVLHSARPCVVMAPKSLLHTSQAHSMPVKVPEEGGKVRLGFIPEEWFTMMYKKTGVTGPYVFGTGLILYMLNKELYILGPETIHAFVALSMVVYGIKKFGPAAAEWADKQTASQLANAYEQKDKSLSTYDDAIKEEKLEQWRLDGRHYLFDAKRENVELQLETEYRERQMQVMNTVKARMDYHIAVDDMKRNKEQEHMVKWIEKNVVESITPQQEKDILNTCISNLKKLAATA
ncbi:ATP synthase F(0) complex subunit B1, mitochondrial-like [Anneissia japonica]|uniref:ATP synthase F(0) complex subunit B1, mitochondrial-like n=1 Tax=Anneissia japonica TaxID=1529436 RepID=UPI001425A94D|nr:ATP synthase F(0) complex subunit B1, mitochondrial-like [Anneissia japonica]